MIESKLPNTTSKIVFVTTFTPRQCGIATFSSDLIEGLEQVNQEEFSFKVCSLVEKSSISGFSSESRKSLGTNDKRIEYRLDTSSFDACIELAEELNKDASLSLVVFEHEFGLYGGEYGSHILSLLAMLDKPSILRFHTVLPGPNETLRETVHHIDQFISHIIVMTNNSKEILIQDYGISHSKISVIAHGIHESVIEDRIDLKEEFGIKPETLVLSNFGLLSENKNIEYALQALAKVKNQFPDFLYLIIGKTHPSVFKNDGESYRNKLKDLVKKYDLVENVQFINRFVSLEELLDFLALTDIYLFTSKDPNQAISGTLTYAMNAGCAIITTPIAQSKEIITPKVGRVITYNDSEAFANEILDLAKNAELRASMGEEARLISKENTWSNVASKHLNLFSNLLSDHKPVLSNQPGSIKQFQGKVK